MRTVVALPEQGPRGIEGRTANAAISASLYLPALDGLRFVAFLLVYLHHFTVFPGNPVFGALQSRGWVGVEIFFVISAFLLFYLLAAEDTATGSINVPAFYMRRLLRVYPLMVGFPLLMLAMYGLTRDGLVGLLALASFTGNFVTWIGSYAPFPPYASHLWTLSSEFQIYLIIPLAYLLYKALGQRNFLVLVLACWLICVVARLAFVLLGAKHPIIWVTPFLRMESVLMGFALAIGWLRGLPAWFVVLCLIASAALLVAGSNVDDEGYGLILLYPVCAVLAGSMAWLVTCVPMLRTLFSSRFMIFMGKRSFGLYVYHRIGYVYAHSLAGYFAVPVNDASGLALVAAIGLVFTTAMAAVSYAFFEKPFLTIKARFSSIESRPI